MLETTPTHNDFPKPFSYGQALPREIAAMIDAPPHEVAAMKKEFKKREQAARKWLRERS